MSKKVLTSRGWMSVALLIFVLTSCFAIVVNGLVARGGVNFSYSISRYVGLGTISSAIFALGNFVVTYALSSRLYEIGQQFKMPKAYYWLVILMAIALVGLLVCPVGYFDQAGVVSLPSRVHEVCSRAMFGCMILIAAWLMIQKKTTRWAKAWCAAYVVYALVCVVGYLWGFAWFSSVMLVYESCYLAWFMILTINLRVEGLESKFIKEK